VKSFTLAFILLAVTAGACAQTGSSQTPAPPPQAGPMHHQHHPAPMAGMHQKHMEAMKADLAKMRAKLDEMKANLAKVKDPAAKQQLQLDADLWEMLAGHIEQMQKMMSDHPQMEMGMMGGGMAGMHYDGMQGCCGCCAGMQGGMKCMQSPKSDTTDQQAPPTDKQ
jgi:hypothetical protein